MSHISGQHFILKALTGADAMASERVIEYSFQSTPLGCCLLGVNTAAVCYLAFAPHGSESSRLPDLANRWPGALLRENSHAVNLTARRVFEENLSPDECELLVRGSAFQVRVWRALLAIPRGEVRSYGEVARSIGRARAVRAVASAIGANPIAWLIPCHRVIRSDGGLGGYRWGLAAKRACLAYEGIQPASY